MPIASYSAVSPAAFFWRMRSIRRANSFWL